MRFDTVLLYRANHPVHEAKSPWDLNVKCGANIFIRDGWKEINSNYGALNPRLEYDRIAKLPRCKRCSGARALR